MVVDDGMLLALLAEFARTLVTDLPVQAVLDQMVRRAVDVLAVTGVGMTLLAPDAAGRRVAGSDPATTELERLQQELQEGPGIAACAAEDAVEVHDELSGCRFPIFAAAARAAGAQAVTAFPLRHGARVVGALALYRDRPGPPTGADLAAARTLADVAAAYVVNAQDREEARKVSDRFREGALHDALTGLPNRALLQERMAHAALRAHRSHTPAAVLFADLDRFKDVNDAYGHVVGDELLAAVAHRLGALVRPGDTLARVSGDEFVILCEDLSAVQDVVALSARIEEAFTRPFRLTGADVTVTASVGIAYSGPGETVTDRLIAHADLAMYRAKRLGGATCVVALSG